MMPLLSSSRYHFQGTSPVETVHYGWSARLTNGAVTTDSGRAPTWMSFQDANTTKPAPDMGNSSRVVSVIASTTDHGVNSGMSVLRIRIVEFRVPAWTWAEPHCHVANVTVGWVGLDRDVTRNRPLSQPILTTQCTRRKHYHRT